jgi:cytochrome P450 family 142 subfamily A polypeptide 1
MTISEAPTPPNHTGRGLDLLDPKLYDDPWETYRWLRREAPIYRDEINDLWVVSTHADLIHVSRSPEIYCNKFGVRPKGASDLSILALDDPEHTRQRRLVNRGFTPRQVRALIPHVRDLTNKVLDEVQGQGEIDFVEDFAIHVPLIVIAELLGLDPEIRMQLYGWSDAMMAGDGETDEASEMLLKAAMAFGEYTAVCEQLIETRRQDPADDLISMLTTAFDEGDLATTMEGSAEAVSGEAMESHELLMFLVTLLVAGNETTRNALSGGLLALSRFPAEKQRLLDRIDDEEFVDLAVDELIRYVSPVLSFSRTVTEDHELHGHQLRKGDKVFMLYQSANRDEAVFERPDELILDRDPNPHVAFGIGTHFCLGANLARMEVKIVFQELLKRLADISADPDASLDRGESGLVLAIQSLPAIFTPRYQP